MYRYTFDSKFRWTWKAMISPVTVSKWVQMLVWGSIDEIAEERVLPWWALDLGGHTVRLLIVVVFHLCFSKSSLSEGQRVKQPPSSASPTRQWHHTPLIQVSTIVPHRNWAVVLHAFNPSPRRNIRQEGDSSQPVSFWGFVEAELPYSDSGRGKW